MELLSRFTSRTILFLRYNQGVYSFDIAANGLGKELELSSQQLLDELNDNTFYKRFVPLSENLLWNAAQKCAESKQSTSAEMSICGDNGRVLDVIVDADYVDDALGDVRCILSLRKR